jgi:hypothetical protein
MATKEFPINAEQDDFPQAVSESFDQTVNSSRFVFDVIRSLLLLWPWDIQAKQCSPTAKRKSDAIQAGTRSTAGKLLTMTVHAPKMRGSAIFSDRSERYQLIGRELMGRSFFGACTSRARPGSCSRRILAFGPNCSESRARRWKTQLESAMQFHCGIS